MRKPEPPAVVVEIRWESARKRWLVVTRYNSVTVKWEYVDHRGAPGRDEASIIHRRVCQEVLTWMW
jgi:hypothetical protein